MLNNGPAIVDNVADWPLFSALHGCTVDFGANNEAKAVYRLRRRTLLQQLKLMSNTKCAACSGYAHRARDCPTNSRLGMLGAASFEDMKIISWARKRVVTENRERQAPL